MTIVAILLVIVCKHVLAILLGVKFWKKEEDSLKFDTEIIIIIIIIVIIIIVIIIIIIVIIIIIIIIFQWFSHSLLK